jgi:hypothetical protein
MRLSGDLVRQCPVCGSQQFWDPAEPHAECAQPSCGAVLAAPARLVTHTTVVLDAGKQIRRHHFTPLRNAETDVVIGSVLRHPETDVIALRNSSSRPWLLHRPERPDASVEPGMAITIRTGMSISVEGVKGQLYT